MPRRRLLRSLALTSLLSAAAFSGFMSQASAQPAPYDGPAWNVIIPQVRSVPVRPNSQPVVLSSVSSNLKITDQVATTTLTMVLTNPSSRPQETEIILPVPDGAAVRAFQLDGAANEGQAKLLPRDEARRIYESIVRAAKDPGLVEFVGYNLIRSSVFPVPAQGQQTIHLTYEQLLTADGPRVDYVLPRSDSLAHAGVNWTYSIHIASKQPISTVYSPSHEVSTVRSGPGEFEVKVGGSPNTPGSLRLSYLLQAPAEKGFTSTILTYPDSTIGPSSGGYFLLLAALPNEARAVTGADTGAIKREVTLVIDRSGSMRGEKIEQAKAAALQVIEGLNPGEYFNIIDYSDQVASFADKPVVKDAESIKRARAYISAMQAVGGTNLHAALLEALRPQPCDGCLPLVLFLTDGLPTVGQTREVNIREDAAAANKFNRRVFSFGVGYDVNAPLLTAIATGSRGAPTFVLPSEDVEVKVGQVFRRLAGPVLASPTLAEFNSNPGLTVMRTRDCLPTQLMDVFEGDQVIILGQYLGNGPQQLRLAGNYKGQERTFDIKFDASGASVRNAFVPRLWATRKIAFLLDEIRKLGADKPVVPILKDVPIVNTGDARVKELTDEVVRLSTKFGILTEYTAFLATDEVDVARRDQVSLFGARGIAPAASVRAGGGGVSQEMNIAAQRDAQCVSPDQTVWVAGKGGQMEQVALQGCQQVADQALFRRGTRWIDARLMASALATGKNAEPTRTVEFGTDDYFNVCNQLASEGRQGLLAQQGEVLVLLEGQNVLVRGPQN